MAVDIEALVPALTKAKEVATEVYVDNSTTEITNNIYYPDTTTINGGKIYTGSIDATKINTEELVVQKVWDGTGEAFAISAYQDVGPVGDKNYNIYGAKMYGGRVEGAYIHGGVVAGAFIQASATFDQLTEYTACTDYPAGMPVVNSFTNLDVVFNESIVTTIPLSVGTSIAVTGDSNLMSYYNCVETVYKFKNGTSPMTFHMNPTTFGNASYGGAETTIPNLIHLGSCIGYKSNDDQISSAFVSKTATQAFSEVLVTTKVRGVTKNLNLTSYLSSMTYLGDFSYAGTHQKEYGVYIPDVIETGLGIYMVYSDGYGYYQTWCDLGDGFWCIWGATKEIKIYLKSSVTDHTSAVDSGVYPDSMFEYTVSAKFNQDPSSVGQYLGRTTSAKYVFTNNLRITGDNTNV